MMDYIVIVAGLCLLCVAIIFWPLKLTRTKSFALIMVILTLITVFTFNYLSEKTQKALNDYQEDKTYQSIVEDYLLGKESAVKNAEDIDAIAFLRSLQRYLQNNSANSEAWMVLGNALQGVDNNRHSLMAYQRAYRVNRNDEAMAIAYVNARLSLLGERQEADIESIDVLNKLLEANPSHENALMLLGAASYQGKDYALAVNAWERLLKALQERAVTQGQEVPEKVLSALQSSINKAQMAAKQQGELLSEQNASFKMPLEIIFNEKVLSDLKQQRSGTSPVLFVYARKPKQKGMPLAAIKHFLHESSTSLHITLSNQDSLAGIDLSKLEAIELSARLSFSGQAIAQAGDWQSDSVIINNDSFDKPHKLAIYKAFASQP